MQMENMNALETSELEDMFKEIKEDLNPLKQDLEKQDFEYRKREGLFSQLYEFSKNLDAQYKKILWTEPHLAQPQPTNVYVEWPVFYVHDAEYHSDYRLQLYWCYDPAEKILKDPWRLPEFIVFDEKWARERQDLDPDLYRARYETVRDILNREADQISKLIKEKESSN